MLTDGALRMLVLLHFHTLGFNPLQLSFLFLIYEFAGAITNLYAGWIASRVGLTTTLYCGLIFQIISLYALTLTNKEWSILVSVIFVMLVQGLSGIAKDLTKMSSKSAVKYLVQNDNKKLFKWVTLLTGSKNAIKGIGFFFGGFLLALLGFKISLILMIFLLIVILVFSIFLIPRKLGKINKNVKFSEVFSTNKNINNLSAARMFLFGARDVWFVVGLPLYFYSILSDGSVEKNMEAFVFVGSFLAFWIIFYGIIQTSSPKIINLKKNKNIIVALAKKWSLYIFPIPILLIFLLRYYNELNIFNLYITIFMLLVFGYVFAINSSIHSYLILEFTNEKRVSMDVGFYYMANAVGRLIGTLLSGLAYTYGGIEYCLFMSAFMLLLNRLCINRINQ